MLMQANVHIPIILQTCDTFADVEGVRACLCAFQWTLVYFARTNAANVKEGTRRVGGFRNTMIKLADDILSPFFLCW